jgi:hypothetical protein
MVDLAGPPSLSGEVVTAGILALRYWLREHAKMQAFGRTSLERWIGLRHNQQLYVLSNRIVGMVQQSSSMTILACYKAG